MKDLNYYKSVYICGMKLKEIKTRSEKPLWWGRPEISQPLEWN